MTGGTARRRALLLGCGTFADESLPALRSPAEDVRELGRVLGDPARGGYDVTTLLDRTSGAVQREIEGFFAGARTDDALNLLYLSCHGVLDDRGRLYFAFADTERGYLGSTAVSAGWVRDRMRSSRSKATLVLVDCCFSGAFLDTMTRSAGTEVATLVRGLPAGSGVAVLTASGDTEVAFEDAESEEVRPSYFTGAVIDGLGTGAADLDGDGRVTVDELYDYVLDRAVRSESAHRPRKLGAGQGSMVVAETAHPAATARPDSVRPAAAPPSAKPRRSRRATYALAAAAVAVAGGAAFLVPGLARSGPEVLDRLDAAPGPSRSVAGSPAPASGPPAPSSGPASRQATAEPTEVPGSATDDATPAGPKPQPEPGRTEATTPPRVTSSGSISAPGSGAEVQNCAYFSGTARLASGDTLILAMRNLSNGDPGRYVEYVFDWDKPATLDSWRGAQYFSGEPGQRYRIELMAVDLSATRSAAGDDAAANALAGQGVRLATRDVVLQSGTTGHACEG